MTTRSSHNNNNPSQLQLSSSRFNSTPLSTSQSGHNSQHRRTGSKNWSNNSSNNSNNNGNGNDFVRRNSNSNSNLNSNSNANFLSPHEFEIAIKHMNDRLLYGLVKSIGCKTTVTVTSGTKYTGILETPSDLTEAGVSVILRWPQLVQLGSLDSKNENFDTGNLDESIIIYDKDIVMIESDDIDFSLPDLELEYNPHPHPHQHQRQSKSGFRTDTDISGNAGFKERELQKWVPDADFDDSLTFGDDNNHSTGGNWDQFEVNERKFGIQSTYDESLYTTKISKDAPDYERRLKEAERIAKEIESQGHNGSLHMAEERGIAVDDSGIDEEDKYSGVIRDDPTKPQAGDALLMDMLRAGSVTSMELKPSAPNKYVPPRQRAANFHGDPAILASSATTNNTPSTIPPKPASATSTSTSTNTSNATANPISTTTPISPSTTPSTIPKKPETVSKTSAPASSTPTTTTTPIAKPSTTNNTTSSTPTPASSIPPKPVSHKQPSSLSQQNISKEAYKLNVQSEIKEFKEFSSNLKVSTKIPQDLLPILAKDTAKQQEIVKKAEAAATSTATSNVSESNSVPLNTTRKAEMAPVVPSPDRATSATSTPSISKKETTTTKFKMNPNSASFSPSGFTPNKNSPLNLNSSLHSPHQQNQPLHQQQRHVHKKTPLSFFGAGKVPTEKQNGENPFETKFNLLLSAKRELTTKLKDPKSIKNIYIIDIEKPFATPTWTNTVEESYKVAFPKQQEWTPPPIQRKMFIPPQVSMPMMPPSAAQVPQPMLVSGPMMDHHHLQQQQQQQQQHMHHHHQQQQQQQHHHPQFMVPQFQPQFIPMYQPGPPQGMQYTMPPPPMVMPGGLPGGIPGVPPPGGMTSMRNQQQGGGQQQGQQGQHHRGSRGGQYGGGQQMGQVGQQMGMRGGNNYNKY